MEETDEIKLFSGPTREIMLFQDTTLLANVFAERALAEMRFSNTLKGLVGEMGEYMRENKQNFAQTDDVELYLAALKESEAEMTSQLEKLLLDSRRHQTAAENFMRFEDDKHMLFELTSNKKAYTDIKEAYEKDLQNIDKYKTIYHKKSKKLEINEVKQLLAKTEDHWTSLEEQHHLLKQKIDTAIQQYQAALTQESESWTHLDTAARMYENAWMNVAEQRIKHTVETLAASFEDTKNIDKHLGQFQISRYLQSVEKFQAYVPENFEKYKYTRNKAALLNALADDKIQGDHVTMIAVAKEDFKKQNDDEISLKTGQRLKQLLPANDDGMAFGEYRSRLGKKKRGYFPALSVILLH